MLIRSNIEFSVTDTKICEHPSLEIQGITISIDEGKVLIINVYRHPGQPTPAGVFNNIFNLSTSAHISLTSNLALVTGDFNCHHAYWNKYALEDCHGRRLAKTIDDHNWTILNEEGPTLVTRPGMRESTIDLALASPGLATLCSSLIVDDSWGSDHHPIVTHIWGKAKFRGSFTYKWILKPQQLREFSSLCCNDTFSTEDLQGLGAVDNYTAFTEYLHKLYNFIPLIAGNQLPFHPGDTTPTPRGGTKNARRPLRKEAESQLIIRRIPPGAITNFTYRQEDPATNFSKNKNAKVGGNVATYLTPGHLPQKSGL